MVVFDYDAENWKYGCQLKQVFAHKNIPSRPSTGFVKLCKYLLNFYIITTNINWTITAQYTCHHYNKTMKQHPVFKPPQHTNEIQPLSANSTLSSIILLLLEQSVIELQNNDWVVQQKPHTDMVLGCNPRGWILNVCIFGYICVAKLWGPWNFTDIDWDIM